MRMSADLSPSSRTHPQTALGAIPSLPSFSRLRDASGYVAAVVLTLAVLTTTLHLWRADLTVPLRYGGGDSTFYLMLVKSTVENGWYLDNERLGPPEGQNLRDFPMPDILHFGIIKLLGYVFRDFVITANLYYLLPYPLTALTAYFVLRRFHLSRLTSLTASVLYACAPYHFCRMIGHPMLAAYFLLPLTAWLIVRVFLNENDAKIYEARTVTEWRSVRRRSDMCVNGPRRRLLRLLYLLLSSCRWRQCRVSGSAMGAFRDRRGLYPHHRWRRRSGSDSESPLRDAQRQERRSCLSYSGRGGRLRAECQRNVAAHRRAPALHFSRRRHKYLEPPRESASEGPSDSPLGFVASAGFLYLLGRFLCAAAKQTASKTLWLISPSRPWD